MELYFVLNEHGEPVLERDMETWSKWFERADRSVARTTVTPEVTVLTVFNGVDDVPDENAVPRLFESRVFGGVLSAEVVQSSTRAEAVARHERLVEWCRIGNAPNCGITAQDIV